LRKAKPYAGDKAENQKKKGGGKSVPPVWRGGRGEKRCVRTVVGRYQCNKPSSGTMWGEKKKKAQGNGATWVPKGRVTR